MIHFTPVDSFEIISGMICIIWCVLKAQKSYQITNAILLTNADFDPDKSEVCQITIWEAIKCLDLDMSVV